MIRDQALAASGLLVERIGGEGVFPYQPAGSVEREERFDLSTRQGRIALPPKSLHLVEAYISTSIDDDLRCF